MHGFYLMAMPIIQAVQHMATTTSISYTPSSKFPPPTNLLKHTGFKHTFSASTSIFSRNGISWRNGLRLSENVDNLIRASAFRETDGDEGVQLLQQDSFIDDSSEMNQSKLVFRGVESIINRLSKWIIFGIFSGFVVWRHDTEALWFGAGISLDVMLSVELKHVLNQERPSTLKSDPGMPSSHAQTAFFIAIFIILSCVKWVGMNEFTITFGGLALAFSCYFSYLRVSQLLHTVSQVVVGAVIGTLFGFWWYWLWNAFVLNAIESSLLVKTIVGLGSAGIWLGYVLYSFLQWLKQE